MTGRSNSLISLLGGAAAGAIAMYLLDPDQGRQRREQLTETAGGALSGAGETFGRAWENLSEQAKALSAAAAAKAAAAGEHVHDAARDFSRSDTVRGARGYAGDAGSHLSSLGSDLLDRVRGLGQRFAGGASNLAEGFSDRSSDVADRARGGVSSARRSLASWVGGEEEKESHLFAHTVGTAAIVAAGAGAMYFLDPERGRGRRAWAGQKLNRIVNDTGRAFHQAGQCCADMMNRTRGTAHELRQSVASGGPVSSEQLLQRVRSEMGHVVSHANQVQVMADAEGNVELTGRVLASELDTLLTTVRRVNGVNQITNRLVVLDREDQITGGAPSGAAIPQM
jgi:gas vesicle protein